MSREEKNFVNPMKYFREDLRLTVWAHSHFPSPLCDSYSFTYMFVLLLHG